MTLEQMIHDMQKGYVGYAWLSMTLFHQYSVHEPFSKHFTTGVINN